MEKVQHGKSVTWKKYNMKKLQYEKVQHGKSVTWKKCNMENMQHEKIAI